MEISNPLVSVIVITYNSNQYILATLESVKNQTYENLELIISDDGSKDDTINKCNTWLSKNSSRFRSVKLISVKENTGTPSNCNRGVKSSMGKWIKIIAGDDLLLDTCIETNVSFSQNGNLDFIFSNIVKIDENGILLNYQSDFDRMYFKMFDTLTAKLQHAIYCRVPITINAPTWFINKDAIEKIGGFDEEYKILEDQTLIYKFLSAGLKISYANEITVKYRIHSASVVKSVNSTLAQDYSKCFYQYRFKNLKKQGIIGWYYILLGHIFIIRHTYYNKSRIIYYLYTLLGLIFPSKSTGLYIRLLKYRLG
jgi:glycosyltransferase involved in cell wall biosynthesis